MLEGPSCPNSAKSDGKNVTDHRTIFDYLRGLYDLHLEIGDVM